MDSDVNVFISKEAQTKLPNGQISFAVTMDPDFINTYKNQLSNNNTKIVFSFSSDYLHVDLGGTFPYQSDVYVFTNSGMTM
jgi:hypothetical protein